MQPFMDYLYAILSVKLRSLLYISISYILLENPNYYHCWHKYTTLKDVRNIFFSVVEYELPSSKSLVTPHSMFQWSNG